MTDQILLTPHDVAKMLGISLGKCYELFHRPDFPVLTLGKLKRVGKVALDERITKHTQNKGAEL